MTDMNDATELNPSSGQHLATIAHEGRIWDVYLEFEDDPRLPDSYRAMLAFSPADNEGKGTVRTAVIIIEDSYELAFNKARAFEADQLEALLRSILP